MSDTLFERAKVRYDAVCSWLERDESTIFKDKPKAYTQGSFALGTVVQPLSDEAKFDIDLICELNRTAGATTPRMAKESVGTEVKSYASGHAMNEAPKEWDKCWTLRYSDADCEFTLDVVPSIPDAAKRSVYLGNPYNSTAIGITDKTDRANYDARPARWVPGNPKGYAEWFKSRMQVQLKEAKVAFANRQQGFVKLAAEEVPDYKVKTPLQQAVQILKRHRDVHFEGRTELQPASILVTTLAALAYTNEATLWEALATIIPLMRETVGSVPGREVLNPVDTSENLADSWRVNPRLRDEFFDWLSHLEGDWSAMNASITGMQKVLELRLGSRAVRRALGTLTGDASVDGQFPVMRIVPQKWASHQDCPTVVNINGTVSVEATYSYSGGSYSALKSGDELSKGASLRFYAKTDIPAPYNVRWQVVNTGAEARRLNGLRGQILNATSAGIGGRIQNIGDLSIAEHTGYSGTHWMQCYIEKGGVIVATSDPFIVCVK